jgi:hypothetical protein
MTSLDNFARVEVKSTLELHGWLWFGTAEGLCRWSPDLGASGTAEAVPGWEGIEVQALAADGPVLVAAVYGPDGAAITRHDADGVVGERIAPPPGEKVKALAASGGTLWIGTKHGVFRHDGATWSLVFGAEGKAEIARLWHRGGSSLAGSVKKLAPDDRPALIESTDGGDSWTVLPQPDYQDLVLAAAGGSIITRWRGARPIGARSGYKKHPITAGLIAEDGTTAVIDGDKLEIAHPGAAKLAAYHPAIAEAEHLHLVPGGAVIAGAQGAWRFEPATGSLTDLLPAPPHASQNAPGRTRRPGKLKRLFLFDGALLGTTTFGTFRSFDDGVSWERADSEWWVLDAEHAARGAAGRWWIACQRGLFRTDDRGGRIDYHKIKVDGPHYAELRALAVAGDRVAIGTKQGLFINRPSNDPERFIRADAFGIGSVEALAWDSSIGELTIATAAGTLWRWDLATPPRVLAELPIGESTMLARDGIVWLAGGDRLTEISGGALVDATPPDAEDGIHLTEAGDRLLVWDGRGAWTRPRGGRHWTPVADWPARIRHVAIDAARGIALATDRDRLFRIQL